MILMINDLNVDPVSANIQAPYYSLLCLAYCFFFFLREMNILLKIPSSRLVTTYRIPDAYPFICSPISLVLGF